MELIYKGTTEIDKTYSILVCNECGSTYSVDDYEKDPDKYDKKCPLKNCNGWVEFAITKNYAPYNVFYKNRKICSGYNSKYWYYEPADVILTKEEFNEKFYKTWRWIDKIKFKLGHKGELLEVPTLTDILDYLYKKNYNCWGLEWDKKEKKWYGKSYLYDPFSGVSQKKTYYETKRYNEFKDAEMELLFWMMD